MMPTTVWGRWAIRLVVAWGCLGIGYFALEAWARMPVSTLSTKLTVMIVYAYGTIVVGIFSGIMACIARLRYGDTSNTLWIPLIIGMLLMVAVVRSLLFP